MLKVLSVYNCLAYKKMQLQDCTKFRFLNLLKKLTRLNTNLNLDY